MIGGMISSTLLTLIVIPAIYGLVKGFPLPRESNADVSVGKQGQTAKNVFGRSQAAE
jgi:copper/silver efflux system protein